MKLLIWQNGTLHKIAWLVDLCSEKISVLFQRPAELVWFRGTSVNIGFLQGLRELHHETKPYGEFQRVVFKVPNLVWGVWLNALDAIVFEENLFHRQAGHAPPKCLVWTNFQQMCLTDFWKWKDYTACQIQEGGLVYPHQVINRIVIGDI